MNAPPGFNKPNFSVVSNPGHLIRSVFQLSLAQGLTWIGGAALAILLPRFLGDVNLGKYTLAFALTTLIGLGADLGVATYLTREVARDPSRAAKLTTATFVLRIPLSLAAAAAAIGFAHVVGYDEQTRAVLYVLSLGIVVNAISGVVFGSLQGLQQMKIMAITNVLSKVGYAALAAVLMFGGAGPFELAAGYVMVSVLVLALATVVLLRYVKPTFEVDLKLCRAILLGGLPFFVWQAALLIYGQIDTILLSFLASDAVVGWYAAAYRIVMIPVFMPTIIVTVVFPALAAAANDHRAFSALARRAVHGAAMVSIPMALGIMLLPDKIIQLLGYPETFNNSALPLILLAPHLPVAAIDVMIGTVLNTRDKQRQWAFTAVAAACLNPMLNAIAIPLSQQLMGNGAVGAAAITTLTEVFMMVVGLRLLPAGVFDRSTVVDVLKFLGAGVAMAGVVFLTRDFFIGVPVVLGAVVYFGACLVVGAVSLGELNQVRLHLVQRSAGATG
jgi:O-antigen/teichoic acid export membrane protein